MRVWLVFCLIALAGCGSKEPAGEVSGVEDAVIHGVLVDQAVMPIPDARIEVLGQDIVTSSDGQGAFELPVLALGEYTVQISRSGFESAQVAWDGRSPLRAELVRLPVDVPHVVPMQWDGFLGCSWYIGTLFATGCLAGDVLPDESRRFETLAARPHFIQSELTWEHTQPAGENLCLRHYASSGIGGDIAAEDACGVTPQITTIDEQKIEETGIGNTRGLERLVWVDHWVPGVAGLAVDQEFAVFTHQFFSMQPEAGWTFGSQGAP